MVIEIAVSPRSSVGRALPWSGRGHRFKSGRGLQKKITGKIAGSQEKVIVYIQNVSRVLWQKIALFRTWRVQNVKCVIIHKLLRKKEKLAH